LRSFTTDDLGDNDSIDVWTCEVLIQSLFFIGAMLEAHPADGETPSFKGSMMIAVAESEADVRALLEKDIYVSSGVWDMEKAQIIPVSVFPYLMKLDGAFANDLFSSSLLFVSR
jgi:hypothetical protein